ncbi:MAG TPA: response regulator [Anaeromyxobacter sp.]
MCVIRMTRLLSRLGGAGAQNLDMQAVVLVIDDDPSLLATLGEALTTDDTAPILATAADALREIKRGMVPDAIVIDLDIPDGCAVLAELERAMPDLVPVITLSSAPRRLLEAGVADAVVMKPFEVGQLRRCVHHACEQPRGAL